MKTMLMICALLVMAIPPVATAEVIGIYTDCTGTSCTLAPGFTSTTVVMHHFSTGATASRFKIAFPPGSTLFSFTSSYVVTGDENGITVLYGQCLTGAWCIGTLIGILAPGQICVMPAEGYSDVIVADCNFVEKPQFGSSAMVGSTCSGGSCEPLAVESSTWGQVKALYR